ncbi:MAG TPA: hypothetical protein HPP83_00545 [Candidatus Hydrogenedentes bacterium]|nr:hypothetical protein [Candidatus Hydrogenedentota bacterium]
MRYVGSLMRQHVRAPVPFVALLMFVLLAFETFGVEEGPSVTPDLAALQQESLTLAAEAKGRFHSDFTSNVASVEFRFIERARNLLPRQTEHDGPPPFIYIIHMAEHAEWYKHSLQYILVLRVEDNGFAPLLVYCGGLNERTLRYEELELGDGKVFEKGESSSTVYAFNTLYIEDWSSGTGHTQQRLLLFRYDEGRGHFCNVFDQHVTFTGAPAAPYEIFKSSVAFRKGERKLKDIIVTTDWLAEEKEPYADPFGKDSTCERCISVFEWNGQHYEGEFKIPEKADSTRKFWSPGKWSPIPAESRQ